MPFPEAWIFPAGIGLVGLSAPVCSVSTPSVVISTSLGRNSFSKRQIDKQHSERVLQICLSLEYNPYSTDSGVRGACTLLGRVFVGMWVGRLFFLHYQFSVDSTLFHFHFCTVVGPARWNKFTGCCSVLKCTGKDSYCCSSSSHPKQHQQRQFLTYDTLLRIFQSDWFCK